MLHYQPENLKGSEEVKSPEGIPVNPVLVDLTENLLPALPLTNLSVRQEVRDIITAEWPLQLLPEEVTRIFVPAVENAFGIRIAGSPGWKLLNDILCAVADSEKTTDIRPLVMMLADLYPNDVSAKKIADLLTFIRKELHQELSGNIQAVCEMPASLERHESERFFLERQLAIVLKEHFSHLSQGHGMNQDGDIAVAYELRANQLKIHKPQVNWPTVLKASHLAVSVNLGLQWSGKLGGFGGVAAGLLLYGVGVKIVKGIFGTKTTDDPSLTVPKDLNSLLSPSINRYTREVKRIGFEPELVHVGGSEYQIKVCKQNAA